MTAADAGDGLYRLAEQITKRRKVCCWCSLAALAQLATLPIALPEARAAVHRLRGRS